MTTNTDFDQLAADYDRYRIGYSAELVDLLVSDFGFRPGGTILDVGVGTGLAAEPFLARGLDVVGIDPSEDMLAAAKAHFPSMECAKARAEALPFGDRTFDGAISAQAFHWVDQAAAFRELLRVVKPSKPVAVWWKMLNSDDTMRRIRKAACDDVGLAPIPDPLRGGFKHFYAAPFAARSLRVIPHVARFTVAEWLGYERSRGQVRRDFGDRSEAYFAALERQLLDVYGRPEKWFDVRYVQYLYVGTTP
jgi:ubiquinone/menaquinone biosynthesis C-methylase UbiE